MILIPTAYLFGAETAIVGAEKLRRVAQLQKILSRPSP